MPRDSSGAYTLPAGNPVATLTVISSTWANTTLSDISTAMTASLSRAGEGPMLAGLKLFDGVIGAPGLTWGTETTSGLYRAAAGDFRWAQAGVDVFTITAAGIGGTFSTGRFANGTVALPSISFASDPNTGIYNFGADQIGITVGGTLIGYISATGFLNNSGQLQTVAGTVGAPGFAFDADLNTGLYRIGADNIGVALGGVKHVDLAASLYTFGAATAATNVSLRLNGVVNKATRIAFQQSGTDQWLIGDGAASENNNFEVFNAILGVVSITISDTTGAVQFLNGTAAVPSISFTSDPDTGVYRVGANILGFAAAGVEVLRLDVGTTATSGLAWLLPDGTAASPAYSFTSDPNTGMYRSAADELSFTTGGTQRFVIGSTGRLFAGLGTVGGPTYSFIGDTDTGMFSSAANRVDLTVGGAVYFEVDATANTVFLGNGAATTFQLNCVSAATANTGAAGAPPAQVVGYIQVTFNGAIRKIPYYAN